MDPELNLFEQYLREAPDDPPDAQADAPPDTPANDAPPDIPDSAAGDPGVGDDPPPDDMGGGGDMGDDPPPDMGDPGDDYSGGFDDDGGDSGDDGEGKKEEPELDEKVSAIMNMNLYQRFLTLLTEIENQITMIKTNMDMLRTVSPETLDSLSSLKKLNENIRLYLKNSFSNENYSKNLLFFNKCLNLLKLLNDIFGRNIRKGVKGVE